MLQPRDVLTGYISLSCQPGPWEDHARCSIGPERLSQIAPRCACPHHQADALRSEPVYVQQAYPLEVNTLTLF